MPGLDRTGPRGEGPRTGRQMGKCKPAGPEDKNGEVTFEGRGMGRGYGRRSAHGKGRSMGRGPGRGMGRGNRNRNRFGQDD